MTSIILKYRDRFRKSPQLSINFGELAIDNFAGGGGASTGIEAAIGRPVDIAINHDPGAVAMHEVNHPGTRHYCESVWAVDPRKICAGRPVGIAWFSPDCKHHSKARGGKPVEKKIRGLAWVAVRWAATVRPRIIILENVEEFVSWGPLVTAANGDCYPCKRRKGETFRHFVNSLRNRGYEVDWKELRACDYGAPTIRKRFFLVARCDGQAIIWPEPTHADPKSEAVKSGRLLPWRTAAECIDWSLPCPSIFERQRPLAEATMRRIAKGVMRYVVESKEPFIVPLTHHGKRSNHSIKEPFKTVTGANRGELALVTPFLTEHANASNQRNMPADGPLRTQCAQVKGGHFALVTPFITKFRNGSVGSALNEPIHTLTAGGTPVKPSTGNTMGLCTAFLAKHYTGVVGSDLAQPIGTVTGIDHHSFVAASVVRHFGESVGSSPSEPVGTITAGGMGKTGIVAAHLARHYGSSYGVDIDNPACTVTGKNKDSLVTSHLVKLRGTCKDGQPVTKPAPTITSGGTHVGEVRAFLMKYYGTDQDPNLLDPLHTVTTKDRFGLVTVKGEEYQIVDIGMRMLSPRELYRAQGFPDDYIIDRDSHGKPITKTEQVAKCGNSVCPPIAEALVRANMYAVESMLTGNQSELGGGKQ
ncbi:MAG: DNA cytosine methyltransferase [Desulfurivibrionaceae bacterium]